MIAAVVIWIAMVLTPLTVVGVVLAFDHCREEPRSAPWPPETLPPPMPLTQTVSVSYAKPEMLALPRGDR